MTAGMAEPEPSRSSYMRRFELTDSTMTCPRSLWHYAIFVERGQGACPTKNSVKKVCFFLEVNHARLHAQ
jgi:hypothetical protein